MFNIIAIQYDAEAPPYATVPISMQVGDITEFGAYDWRVLEVQDGRALIITDKIIESKAYNEIKTDVTWENCDLRAYLNGEFYNSFSDSDKARIVQVTNQNLDNQWFGTPGGNTTRDYVFLLSLDEVVRYFGDSGRLYNREDPDNKHYEFTDQYNENRIAYHVGGTYYSDEWEEKTRTINTGQDWWWWLRSPGHAGNVAADVGWEGNVFIYGSDISWICGGVRPALWLDLKQ